VHHRDNVRSASPVPRRDKAHPSRITGRHRQAIQRPATFGRALVEGRHVAPERIRGAVEVKGQHLTAHAGETLLDLLLNDRLRCACGWLAAKFSQQVVHLALGLWDRRVLLFQHIDALPQTVRSVELRSRRDHRGALDRLLGELVNDRHRCCLLDALREPVHRLAEQARDSPASVHRHQRIAAGVVEHDGVGAGQLGEKQGFRDALCQHVRHTLLINERDRLPHALVVA
jgi:hypothetical protein